ncbi:MAG: hypothetical protein JST01_14520, partial [Cyanobacteria bacterium SZAS TMP-1]|nr:hypothetical protein [Cyanobacteria bacterium SZAS TMP-1]
RDELDKAYLEKRATMAAVCQYEAALSFLQWLVKLTGFNKPCMNMEDASRRDIWLTIRPYIPVEKLPLLEHYEIQEQQDREYMMLELASMEDDLNG